VTVPFLKVCEPYSTFLSRPCLAHDLATFDGLLLALRHAGMTIRLKVIDREWTIVVHMCVKGQHQRWTLPYDPHASVAMTMDPAFVTFRTLEPTLQVQIVGRKLSYLTPHKQPRFKAAHYLGKVLFNGIRAGLPLLLQRAEPRLTLCQRGHGTRPQHPIHGLQVLGVETNLRQGLP